MGGSNVQLEIKTNWKTYFYTEFYYVFVRAFVLVSMYRYSWLITFEIFRNFFGIEGWVGGVYRIQTFFGFLYFFINIQNICHFDITNIFNKI